MTILFHEILCRSAKKTPRAVALSHGPAAYSYGQLASKVSTFSVQLLQFGLQKQDRVAVYLPKQFEAVVALFAVSMAGGVFVPVNPLLKPRQVVHILQDSGARILFTSVQRKTMLSAVLDDCSDLEFVITPNDMAAAHRGGMTSCKKGPVEIEENDLAALIYTSGSTGKPKGVMLSHRNLVVGAKSVSTYLNNDADDRILCVLPFSFDYGLSQLTTAFYVGARAVLMEYLFPQDVIRAIEKEGITGLAGISSLWLQLLEKKWSNEARNQLRYITNSGGNIPQKALNDLQAFLPDTDIFLMYGFTEAFRSTYLSPVEVKKRPNSVGKVVPHGKISVVNQEGKLCAPNEAGELVHSGSLVALGYWRNAEKTKNVFRPIRQNLHPTTVRSAWSGDKVRMDKEGYLYFIGRYDYMIKTSGYRVSPNEVEGVVNAVDGVKEAIVIGLPHPTLGQAIAVFVVANNKHLTVDGLINECKIQLPAYMLPLVVRMCSALPHTVNGKIDRERLLRDHGSLFEVGCA